MKELTLKATIENLTQVTAFIDEQLEALGCSMKAQMQLDVAIDELFSNIAHYAYTPETGEATVQFAYDEAARSVSITLIDSGIPFNPLNKAEPDLTIPVEERRIGGLGIFLVRKTMDLVEYRYENGKNVLTIHKQI